MSLVAKLDLANLLSAQAERPEETWANHQDTESDQETVFDGEMEMVYPDDEMENQVCLVYPGSEVRTYLVYAGSLVRTCPVYAGNQARKRPV